VPESPSLSLPRLRQAVVAARDLDAVAGELRQRLKLGEPFADPGVAHFGLRNAVFALGDTFLEVVSPVQPDTAAGRLIERRGGDCGYMLMFQVDDLAAARSRAAEQGVREVFEVSLDDMSEVHLHPADMRAAIVSLSQPDPPGSWRWGGPGWEQRSASVGVAGATIAVAQPVGVAARWNVVLGTEVANVGVQVSADENERGLTEIVIEGLDADFELAGVRFHPSDYEEE
jgi:Glyoxalase-like domain